MSNLFRPLLLAACLLIFGAFQAVAQNLPELNLTNSGLALRGVDPVSYVVAGKPQKGEKTINVKHAGGTYRFTSNENRDLFLADPDKYLPAYGGYCAYGTAVGNKVDGDPYLWHIVDGQLYFNINRSVDRTWQRNVPRYVRDADQKWPDLKFK